MRRNLAIVGLAVLVLASALPPRAGARVYVQIGPPAAVIETRVVGLFRMKDRGQNDYKILGVPHSDPLFAQMTKLENVPPHFLREVEHFFSTYKQLEGVKTESLGWASANEGMEEVFESVDRYRKATEGLRR